MITVAQAQARVLAALAPLGPELVSIDEALGRVLAADLIAPRALPPTDNSAMDGFAVRAAELPARLPVAGTIAAGDAPTATLAPGTAQRIMTGAPLPAGADAVVIREEADDLGAEVDIQVTAAPGENVRRRGEDVAQGDTPLYAGARLAAGEIGLLAALGQAAVQVGRAPRVAILSTGDELVGVDVPPRPGQIVNSNANALAAQVREAGGVPIHAGIAPDQPEPLLARIRAALAADVLITSGGVSVGDFDYVKSAFEKAHIKLDFWKVAMKPGKPLAFGVAPGGVPVFGLPGNPVSSMIGFELFVRPALLAMQGATGTMRPLVPVAISTEYRKQPGRAHYLRAALRRQEGALVADVHPKQGSAMLSSMVAVDALVIAPVDATELPAQSPLEALMLRPR